MKILMLGNSFTSYNDLPGRLAELLGAEVTAHTRGGARLSEQLNPETKMGAMTAKALREEKWDYVVLQEMSKGPISSPKHYRASVEGLCRLIHANGAVPVVYATWAYQKGSVKMDNQSLSYHGMMRELEKSCHAAAKANGALLAPVGRAFYEHAETEALYAEDGKHPSARGTELAAQVIAETIRSSEK